jgi:hypothetical protein
MTERKMSLHMRLPLNVRACLLAHSKLYCVGHAVHLLFSMHTTDYTAIVVTTLFPGFSLVLDSSFCTSFISSMGNSFSPARSSCHYNRLAQVEIHLIMRLLECTSRLKLGRVNRRCYQDAQYRFAWSSEAELLIRAPSTPHLAALVSASLLRFALTFSVHLEWSTSMLLEEVADLPCLHGITTHKQLSFSNWQVLLSRPSLQCLRVLRFSLQHDIHCTVQQVIRLPHLHTFAVFNDPDSITHDPLALLYWCPSLTNVAVGYTTWNSSSYRYAQLVSSLLSLQVRGSGLLRLACSMCVPNLVGLQQLSLYSVCLPGDNQYTDWRRVLKFLTQLRVLELEQCIGITAVFYEVEHSSSLRLLRIMPVLMESHLQECPSISARWMPSVADFRHAQRTCPMLQTEILAPAAALKRLRWKCMYEKLPRVKLLAGPVAF